MTDIQIPYGVWANTFYFRVHSDDGVTIVYRLAVPNSSWSGNGDFSFKYDRSNKTWSDVGPAAPFTFNSVNVYFTSVPFLVNPAFVHGFNTDGARMFQIQNPHWEEEQASGTLSWFPDTNYLVANLSASNPTTIINMQTDMYYRIKNTTVSDVSEEVYHTTGTPTTESWRPPVSGTYELQKVFVYPLEVIVLDTKVVTQPELLAWHALNDPPDDDPPDDDPPENDPPPTPVFVPRSARRGNLNFW